MLFFLMSNLVMAGANPVRPAFLREFKNNIAILFGVKRIMDLFFPYIC